MGWEVVREGEPDSRAWGDIPGEGVTGRAGLCERSGVVWLALKSED